MQNQNSAYILNFTNLTHKFQSVNLVSNLTTFSQISHFVVNFLMSPQIVRIEVVVDEVLVFHHFEVKIAGSFYAAND